MKSLKEIKFKTQGQLAAYLMNKGPLMVGAMLSHIYYDPDNYPDDPFRFKMSTGGSISMNGVWDIENHEYYTKTPWYECIPEDKYVPCYLSNNGVPNENSLTDLVKYVKEFDHYVTKTGMIWKFATPVPLDKLWVPEL